MTSAVKPVATYDDFGSLTALKRDSKTGSASTIREVARQFESLFTRMVLKSVRDADFGDPLFGDDAMKQYQEMYDDQLAIQLSSGKGLGLADMLVRQLSESGAGHMAGTAAGADVGAASTAAAESAGALGSTQPGGSAARIKRASPYAPLDRSTAATATTGGVAGAAAAPPSTSTLSRLPTASTAPATSPASTDESRAAFVQDLWPEAVKAGAELGVDPRTLVAHAALETGWGQSLAETAAAPCSHNLFGIKATPGWSGASMASRTVEFEAGVPRVRTDRFRAYGSTKDCFQDYVALLRGEPRYARALGTGTDVAAFGSALQQGGYATDPQYASKLAAVANSLKQIPVQPLTTSQDGR
jgi:flagellar protein FlgJ